MKFVLDASAAASWTLEEERDDLALAIAENVLAHGACVPPFFVSEIHNVLLVAVRRKRATPAKAANILTALERLPIRIETRGIELGSTRVVETAQRCGVSAYDATYIVLAEALHGQVMTRDRRMRAAAAALNVLWAPTPGA